MSGLRKLIQSLSKMSPWSSKMKTVASPRRLRKYEDVRDQVPAPGAILDSTVLESVQLEPLSEDFILLDDLQRECVHLSMLYYEYLYERTAEFHDDPLFMDKVNDIISKVTQDLPIKKQALLEICPELFPYDIIQNENQIPLEEKYKHLGQIKDPEPIPDVTTFYIKEKGDWQSNTQMIARTSEPISDDKKRLKGIQPRDLDGDIANAPEYYHEEYSPYELYCRHYYIWEQTKRTYMKSADLLDNLAEKLGSVGAAIKYVELKGDSRTPEEQEIIDGLNYVRRLMEEQHEFSLKVHDHYFQTIVLPFPMPGWLKQDMEDSLREILNNRLIGNFYDLVGVPDNAERAKKEIAMKEQRAKDALALDNKERREAIKMIQDKGDDMLVRRDLGSKDEQLIRKMNYLSEMVQVKKPAEPVADFSKKFDPESLRRKLSDQMKFGKLEGELHIENLVKMIYLNNAAPGKYDLEFWAETLNIKITKLKNIFYNVSYPIIQENEPIGKITFIEVARKKEMFDVYQETQRRWKEKQDKSDN